MITKPAIRTPLPMLVEAAYHVSTDALFHKEWQELHYADRAEVAVVVQIDVPVPAIAHVFLAAGIKHLSPSLAATTANPLLACASPLQDRHSRSIGKGRRPRLPQLGNPVCVRPGLQIQVDCCTNGCVVLNAVHG